MDMLPCPSCGRHVRMNESACPFCRRSPIGWTARTVAVALAGAALAGCPARQAPKYGAPPPPPTAEIPADTEGGPAAEAQEEGAPEVQETPAPDPTSEDVGDMRTLYGAPPEPESDR